MSTNIRRSLIIGLGGTGMDTLLRVKKLFVETYGELPPMIGLLGIDTDGGAYNKVLPSSRGDIKLDPSEQLPIRVENASEIYQKNKKDHFSWIPNENVGALSGLRNNGAGQVRTNGRFVVKVNSEIVKNKIKASADAVKSARVRQESRYQVLGNDQKLEIHLVFSMCGGTGAGTFIDIAYLLQEILPDDSITAYGVLPDVFETMSNSGMTNVKPNAMGAVQDVDFLMKMAYNSDPISFDWITETTEATERPFKNFFVIDNKNTSGDVYDHVGQLENMISLALVASSGDLGAANVSIGDNLSQQIDSGAMNVAGKQAWAATMGVCEIVFRRDNLKRLYTCMGAQCIIDRMTNYTDPVGNIVNGWIDSEKVNIRENNGNDNVIDFIMPLNCQFPLSIGDAKNADPEVKGYLGTAVPASEEVNKRVGELKQRVEAELDILVSQNLNTEGGIAKTEKVLNGLESELDVFLGEMTDELDTLQTKTEPTRINEVNTAQSDLTDYVSKIIKRSATVKEKKEDLENAVYALAAARRDIARHQAAIIFFNSIKNKVAEYNQSVAKIKENLKTVYANATDEISSLRNSRGQENSLFTIDLTARRCNVDFDPADINMGDYILSLGSIGIMGYESLNSQAVQDNLYGFVSQLPCVVKWDDETVENLLRELDEEEFKRVMQKAHLKSVPMLVYNRHGYVSEQLPADYYYVGVADKANSRLRENDNFKNSIENAANGAPNVDFASIGMTDRIIIYHQSGVVPAFMIGPVMSYEVKYKRCAVSPHFDRNLKLRMENEDYTIMPQVEEDDSMELWVKGLIHKRIFNEAGTYYIVNETRGDSLNGFRYKLHNVRHNAFEMFHSDIDTFHDELADAIKKQEEKMGKDRVEELYNDVKSNYYEKYSAMTVKKETLSTRPYKEDKKLIGEEMKYVSKEL